MNPKIRFKKSDGSDYQNYAEKCIGIFLASYTDKDNSELHPVVAVGRYGIRKREDIYSKDLSEDISKNRVIDKNTMIIGMGSKQIDLGFLFENIKYSVSPAYLTFHIHDIEPRYFELLMNHKNTQLSNRYMIVGARQGKSVDKDGLLAHNLNIPVNIEEQTKIAKFFSEVDNLITSAENELEATRRLKKAMLQKMFPKKGEKVPEIRFPEFTDDWEQRKLDSITDVRDGTHDSPQYVVEGHPFITSKNVKDGYINYEDVQFISDNDFYEINKRSRVDINDILMGMIGTIGNIALVRKTPDFAIKNVALIKDTGDVYYRYLYHSLQSPFVTRQLSDNLDGGTQKFIALNKIRELYIPLPSAQEQHKIGEFLEEVDNLITLHQRKVDAYKKFKKAMMQKMFV